MKGIVILTAAFMVFASPVSSAWAQDEPIPSPESGAPMLSSTELDQMLEPIALYPDPLIAQVLPAATQPSQIALAANYLNQGGDPNLIDQQPWDSSVKALAHYPDVLNVLNGNLQWTSQLGQAFIDQPTDVMNSIQSLRAQAQDLGNLQSTPEEDVVSDDGTIEIVPADPNLIYVPIYDPGIIFFQRPYGRHFITYGHGYRAGGWLNHDFNWHGHNVIVWDRDHPRPANWWHERPSQRPQAVVSHAPVWRPQVGRPAISPVARGGDRGYARPAPVRMANPQPKSRVEVTQVPAHNTVREREPAPVQHSAPVQHAASAPTQRSSAGALSAPQSARDTRAASSRGQQSRQTASHAASPPAHTSAPSGGGGGASRRR